MNKYYWLAAVAALVIGFQNCSNSTQFVSDESNILKMTGDLAPVAAEPAEDDISETDNDDVVDNTDSNVTPPAVAMPPAPPTMPPVAELPAAPPVMPTPALPPVAGMPPAPTPVASLPPAAPAPSAPPVAEMPPAAPTMPPVGIVPPPVQHDDIEHDDDEHEMEDADHSYVCILQGPGKSVKVGIVSDLLGGASSAAASVCMSKRACLELMSQKFPVKAAEKRGYCPAKNPNAVNMSDAEIKAKLLGK